MTVFARRPNVRLGAVRRALGRHKAERHRGQGQRSCSDKKAYLCSDNAQRLRRVKRIVTMSWIRGWVLSCLFLSSLSSSCMSASRWPAMPSASTSHPAVAPSSAPRPDLAVRQIQGILHEKGYNPGPIDGLMGNKTRTALRQFQSDQNLPVTGSVDAQTRAVLLQQSTDSPRRVSGGIEP
jgi:hypothetical protein